eukprot:jgi/Chrzof1/8071/UNPLg00116.t1
MALTPYLVNDPFLSQIERAMDRAFDRAVGRGTPSELGALLTPFTSLTNGNSGHPMDITETKDSFVVTADAPGFHPEDIQVELHDGALMISGKRKQEKEEKDPEGKVVRRERHFAQFSRCFTLPENVKEDGIAASLDRGVLKVTVPKTAPPQKPEPKRITVKGGSE